MLLTTRDPEGGALFGEAEVFDNVMTFVFAGHETTSNALAWTLYLLSQFPECDARVAREAMDTHGNEPADLSGLGYTRMVLEESMRLYPPVPIISRDSVGADVVGGIAIRPQHIGDDRALDPAPPSQALGAIRTISIPSVSRRAAARRSTASPTPVRRGPAHLHRHGLRDAGSDDHSRRRSCDDYRLELVPGHPVEPQARVTLRPKYGLKMRVLKRV